MLGSGRWAADPFEVEGINTRAELALAAEALRDRINEAHMLAGVTIVDPASTWIDAGIEIEPDVTIRRWRGPQPACDVDFYRIDGGGHTWPGSPQTLPRFLFGSTSQTISATRVIWDFLAAHSR